MEVFIVGASKGEIRNGPKISYCLDILLTALNLRLLVITLNLGYVFFILSKRILYALHFAVLSNIYATYRNKMIAFVKAEN